MYVNVLGVIPCEFLVYHRKLRNALGLPYPPVCLLAFLSLNVQSFKIV